MTLVQDAIVLENLINQLAASFGGRKDDAPAAAAPGKAEESK